MKQSAGILLYRTANKQLEFFLVHPGGPFWKNKDEGAWSIPKGEIDEGEEPLAVAKRESKEETGGSIEGEFMPLTPIKQKSRKLVHAWAVEGDIDASIIISNTFSLEWPPHSGKFIDVPEVDRAEWFDTDTAMQKINPAQVAFIEELCELVKQNKDAR